MASRQDFPDAQSLAAAATQSDAVRALFMPIADAARETAVFAYFDPNWRLLGMRHVPSHLTHAAAVPLRRIVADALAFDCATVVMAHNHPSGDAAPSEADYALTRRLARVLHDVDVRLADHLVLAPGRCESFRARGLL